LIQRSFSPGEGEPHGVLTGFNSRRKVWLNYVFRRYPGIFMTVKTPEPKEEIEMASAVQTKIAGRLQETADSLPVWMTAEWLEPRLVAVTLAALVTGSLLERAEAASWLVTIFAVTAYVAGGAFGTRGALKSLFEERKFDVDGLMVLAALGAALVGAWAEGATLLFLFSLSNTLQTYAIGRSRRAIRSLYALYPEQARVKRGDDTVTVGVEDLAVGDLILIEPGERIPVDGVVKAGRSAVDQSPITGESMPVDKAPGDEVFAGTLNKQGALDVKVTKLASESTLSRIVNLVEQAQENKAPTERALNKFEERYALGILGFIVLMIIVPPLLFGADFGANFYRAMVLMTVASPCALAISVPASFIAAIAAAARRGVMFKGGAYLEQLADIKAVAFDKTGTLTAGQPTLTVLAPVSGVDENDLLAWAAAVEARSEHPLAQAIIEAARNRNLNYQDADDFEAVSGRGARGIIDNEEYWVASPAHLVKIAPIPAELANALSEFEEQGYTAVGVVRGQTWLGLIALADKVRPDSKDAVAALKARGIQTAMLTGDNPRAAAHIARSVGIDVVHAGLMPEDKASVIESLRAKFGPVAMIGDGINDAPALALADLGVAMGGAGTDVALETADLVLMGDKISRLSDAIDLSRLARRVVKQNMVFAIGVMILLTISTFVVALPLPLGVLGHEGSTVVVVLNGLIQLLVLPGLRQRREHAKA
jgi:Zn2+/Cd2+-exporting ATPase